MSRELQSRRSTEPEGCWLSDEDMRIADEWYKRVARPNAMPVFIGIEHEDFPEMLEIGLPGSARYEPRWMAWRTVDGVFMEDLPSGQIYGPGTMADALDGVGLIVAGELAHTVSKLPATLIPPL
jgi:hypothetical protein